MTMRKNIYLLLTALVLVVLQATAVEFYPGKGKTRIFPVTARGIRLKTVMKWTSKSIGWFQVAQLWVEERKRRMKILMAMPTIKTTSRTVPRMNIPDHPVLDVTDTKGKHMDHHPIVIDLDHAHRRRTMTRTIPKIGLQLVELD